MVLSLFVFFANGLRRQIFIEDSGFQVPSDADYARMADGSYFGASEWATAKLLFGDALEFGVVAKTSQPPQEDSFRSRFVWYFAVHEF